MSFTDWEDALCHFGVSKDNGAPGVGTGNWRRGGSSHKHSGRFPLGHKSAKSPADDINSVREYLKEQAGIYHKRQEKAEKKYKKVLSKNEKRAAKAAARIEKAKKFVDDNRFMQLKFESMSADDKLRVAEFMKTEYPEMAEQMIRLRD